MKQRVVTTLSGRSAPFNRRGARCRHAAAAAALALVLMQGVSAGAADEDEGDDAGPPHITVRGTASAFAPPDVAVLRLRIDAEDGDAAAALRADAAALAAVTEAARGEGIAAADIEGGTVTLERAAADGAGASRVYRAAMALRVRLRDPARIGAVLSALVGKGATRIEGVDYRPADPAALLAKLTGLAVADARRRAEAAAEAAHVKLGRLLSIEPPDEPAGGSRLDRVPGAAAVGIASTTVEADYAIDP